LHQSTDWLETKIVSEMTCIASSGALNPT